MRYNAKIQSAADAYAKKQGWLCAIYKGPTDDSLVFCPRDNDNEPKITGLAVFIVYKNGEFSIDRSLNFYKYADKLHYQYFPKKGKAIYEIYRQMDKNEIAASEEDKVLIHQIAYIPPEIEGNKRIIGIRDTYEALEIADRLGMTLEFFPSEYRFENGDIVNFIRIIPGKLPQLVQN